MDLKEEIIKVFNKKDKLFEAMFKIVNSYGREIDTLNSQEELEDYNRKHEDEDFQVIDIKEPLTPKKNQSKSTKDIILSKETKKEILDFYQEYYNYRDSLDARIKQVQEDDPSEYSEIIVDRKKILKYWWNNNIKRLSKEARNFINLRLKEKRQEKYSNRNFNEAQEKEFTFYKTLLEATFNPNVKSSWITQIWFEPNEDFEEDEEGNPIPLDPKDPNLKGTVYMRVKNSKTGKVYPTYEFYDVPRKVYIMWRRARSKGKYFWRRMKYNYEG